MKIMTSLRIDNVIYNLDDVRKAEWFPTGTARSNNTPTLRITWRNHYEGDETSSHSTLFDNVATAVWDYLCREADFPPGRGSE